MTMGTQASFVLPSNDFVEGFKLLNPNWIVAILEAGGAPNWPRQIICTVAGHRSAIPRVIGRLFRVVHVNVVFCTGNALAPWILCLALHPIVGYSNCIPDAIAMRAYVDAKTAGTGHKWVQRTQAM